MTPVLYNVSSEFPELPRIVHDQILIFLKYGIAFLKKVEYLIEKVSRRRSADLTYRYLERGCSKKICFWGIFFMLREYVTAKGGSGILK